HLEAAPRQTELALDRLVRVGDAGNGDHLRLPAFPRKLLAQQRRRVALDENLGLEVQTGGKAEGFVRGARETISASMLAASIRVDTELEPHVGTLIAGEDRARRVCEELGPGSRRVGV